MIFASAAPTPYDLRFDLFGFPVRVHPAFWLIAFILGAQLPPKFAVIWVGVVFLSVLVHELGHALLQRWFGGRPEIVLYGLGGYAMASGMNLNWWRAIVVAFAGPLAGFLLAAASYAFAMAMSGRANLMLGTTLDFLVLVNVFWGIINLLPIWPLDGGHISRELLVRFLVPSKGIVVSLMVSIACAVMAGCLIVYWSKSLWNALLFGFLAYQSYQALSAYRASKWR